MKNLTFLSKYFLFSILIVLTLSCGSDDINNAEIEEQNQNIDDNNNSGDDDSSGDNSDGSNSNTTTTVDSQLVNYNYRIAFCVGTRSSTAWIGESIVVMIEGENPSDRDPEVMTETVRLLEEVYAGFENITGLTDLPNAAIFQGKTVIEIPQDNCGFGGLANHGALGISTGVPFFNILYNSLENNFRIIPQVFMFEINRNFWPEQFNNKFDWSMDNQIQNYGFWTVGMNNAQAVMLTEILGIELDYFGANRIAFRNKMVDNLTTYINNPDEYDFNFGWLQSLMPWAQNESINDLMSGLLIFSYENFGEERWLNNFYRYIQDPRIIDRSGMFAFQECRDNIYKIWSLSAETNLIDFFETTLRWTISQTAKDDIIDML